MFHKLFEGVNKIHIYAYKFGINSFSSYLKNWFILHFLLETPYIYIKVTVIFLTNGIT